MAQTKSHNQIIDRHAFVDDTSLDVEKKLLRSELRLMLCFTVRLGLGLDNCLKTLFV